MNEKNVVSTFMSLLLILSSLTIVISTEHTQTLEEKNVNFHTYDYEFYYPNVDSLSGELLRDQLYDIIRNHTVVSYSSIWDHIRNVDADPSNNSNVILFYMQRSQSENDTCGDGNECSSQSWNREHVWPKSHGNFGTSMTKVAGTDLHSLRPVDNTVNSARSDKDFGNATNSHWECIECDSSTDYWEPSNETKGDAARSVFYMDVRYNGFENEPHLSLVNGTTQPSSDTGFLGDLCTLYHWHITDPVSIEEIERNNEIYQIQGNRNPFIDNENFVKKIWGEICDPKNSDIKDTDNDGIHDSDDVCPHEDSTGYDEDEDGCLDDTDGDGVTDDLDLFPFNESESLDSDLDGVGDNSDMFPFDSSEILDSDLDGVGDNSDVFPYFSYEWADSDSDGVGDNSDVFPDNSLEWIDTDSDGYGDNSDAFPLDPQENLDSDSDGVGDNLDKFPFDSNRHENEKSDKVTIFLIFMLILTIFFIIRR